MSTTFKIYTLAILSFLVGTSENVIAGILDKISESMHVSIVTVGQLITVFSLAYAIGVPIMMSLTTRMERRKLLLLSLAFFVCSNVLAFLSSSYDLIILSRILMGVSAGMTVVTALTIASKISKPGKEGSSISAVLMGFTASLILGVPLGRLITAAYDWKTVFLGISLIGLLAIPIIWAAIPKLSAELAVPLREQLALIKQPKMLLALGVSFFWIISYGIFFSYISPFLLTVTGLSDGTVSAVLLALGIASLIGSRSGGAATDKWGIPTVLLGGLTLCFLTLMLIFVFGHNRIIVIGLLLIWSGAVWSVGAPQQLNLIKLAPESSGVMLSLNNSIIQVAMAAGASVGGLAVTRISLSSISWTGAIGSLFAVYVVYLLRRITNITIWRSRYESSAKQA